MSTRTSPASLHAARMLFEKYDFTVRPPEGLRHRFDKLQATEAHVAIFIDYKTGIKDVGTVRSELSYWQDVMKTGINDNHTAQQITAFVGRMVEILERVPHFTEEEGLQSLTCTALTATAGAITVQMNLSKASLEAMETLFYYYAISPKIRSRFPDERITKRAVAGMIESCLQVGKAMKALPILRQANAHLRKGQASADDIVRVLRRVGNLFEFLPSFEFQPGTLERDESKLLTV